MNSVNGQPKVVIGRSHPQLGRAICRNLGIRETPVTFTDFANGNVKVAVDESVRGADVFVVQTSCPPVNDHLVELLVTLDALKYASADRITVVASYYPYVRSDKKDEPRISVTARLVADLMETAGANRILTMKLHAPQIIGFPRIPMDQLIATVPICDYLAQRDLRGYKVVAPDVGRAKEAEQYANRLDLPMAILDKRRKGDELTFNLIGSVDGEHVLLFDDEILSAGTMIEGVRVLKEKGARRVLIGATHGFLAKGAATRLQNSPVDEVIVGDTIPIPKGKRRACPKITVLHFAGLFSDAIRAIHGGDSVGALFGGDGDGHGIE